MVRRGRTWRKLSPHDVALIACLLAMIFCWEQAALRTFSALRLLTAADSVDPHAPYATPPDLGIEVESRDVTH